MQYIQKTTLDFCTVNDDKVLCIQETVILQSLAYDCIIW